MAKLTKKKTHKRKKSTSEIIWIVLSVFIVISMLVGGLGSFFM